VLGIICNLCARKHTRKIETVLTFVLGVQTFRLILNDSNSEREEMGPALRQNCGMAPNRVETSAQLP
jgi:hypothetical protein